MADNTKEMRNGEEILETPDADMPREEEQAPEAAEASEAELLAVRMAELNDQYLRLMAEYDNYRKRSVKEKEEIYPNATAAAVERFLPVMDDLERARQYECGTEEFAEGFRMICQCMENIFKGFGVEPVGEVGEAFDPNKHNAVMHIEDPSLGENVISQVLQKGYRIGDRIIRYAMVQTAN